MPGLEPGIHDSPPRDGKTWMAGTSPAMTIEGWRRLEKSFFPVSP